MGPRPRRGLARMFRPTAEGPSHCHPRSVLRRGDALLRLAASRSWPPAAPAVHRPARVPRLPGLPRRDWVLDRRRSLARGCRASAGRSTQSITVNIGADVGPPRVVIGLCPSHRTTGSFGARVSSSMLMARISSVSPDIAPMPDCSHVARSFFPSATGSRNSASSHPRRGPVRNGRGLGSTLARWTPDTPVARFRPVLRFGGVQHYPLLRRSVVSRPSASRRAQTESRYCGRADLLRGRPTTDRPD